MVTNVTNFSRSGLFDWLYQRVSALVLLAYFLVVIGYILSPGDLVFTEWKAFMLSTPMKLFSLLSLVMLIAHAWVGLWTITTDYLTDRALGKALLLRFLTQAFCGVLMFVYFVWGLMIFWGS